jgi:hypothetical protein
MATAQSPLRFADSIIHWGTTPDLATGAAESRMSGHHAVELIGHDPGWFEPQDRFSGAPGDLQVATRFDEAALLLTAR